MLGALFCGQTLFANPALPTKLQVKTTVNWEQQTFDEFITWMRNDVGWNVVVRWSQVSKINITPETSLNLTLKDVPTIVVDEALQQMSSELSFQLISNVMTISTKADFASALYTRAYDLTDILMMYGDNDNAPSMDLSATIRREPIIGDIFLVDSEETHPDMKHQIEELIVSLNPASWQKNGGKGSISWIGTVLIIRNSIEIHENVAGSFSL